MKTLVRYAFCFLLGFFAISSGADSSTADLTSPDLTSAGLSNGDNYAGREDVREFAEDFAKANNRDVDQVLQLLHQAERKQAIIDAISRPAEKVLNWGQYRKIFIEPKRIENGVLFWKEHRALISEVSRKYKVDPEIIVAIIGIETRYGNLTGKYRVLDALMTLGFDYEPRGKFFRGQLEQFLLMVEEQKLDPLTLTGSYAGAMGYGQFIPSSYRSFAVDYDGDGVADIWQNPADAIASVANYFAMHEWQQGNLVTLQLSLPVEDRDFISEDLKPDTKIKKLRKADVALPAELDGSSRVTVMELETGNGMEYWLGFENFYVITRYNHSHMYAMAAYQLSQILKLELDK